MLQSYRDDRLRIEQSVDPSESIIVDCNKYDKSNFWKSGVIIFNEDVVLSDIVDVYTILTDSHPLWVKSGINVFHEIKKQILITSPMIGNKYPFDTQAISIQLSQYKFYTEHVVLTL
jgi:hypothetical protein